MQSIQKLLLLKIKDNNTGKSDEDLKKFLKHYHENFREPIIDIYKDYLRAKYNPDLNFEESMLLQLGFKHCGVCYK